MTIAAMNQLGRAPLAAIAAQTMTLFDAWIDVSPAQTSDQILARMSSAPRSVNEFMLRRSREGTAFWASVCADPANRGVRDVLIVCCEGLTGFPEAIAATWSQAGVRTWCGSDNYIRGTVLKKAKGQTSPGGR